MTKAQKVWMWVFAGMFVVPEILYGNLIKNFHINFIPIFSDWSFFENYSYVALVIIGCEIFGIFGIIYLVSESIRKKKVVKFFLLLILSLILLLEIFSLYFTYALSHISIL